MSLRGAKATKQSEEIEGTIRLPRFARNDGLVKPIFFFVFILCACSIPAKIPLSEQSRIISNIPFYAQETYQCGPASLAGVMNYSGISVTPDEIAKEIYSPSARGTLDIDMVIYPQSKGLVAEQYSGNMDDLRKNIDAGYPLIVLVDYGILFVSQNHFMVVTGYNENGIIVNSGKEQHKFISEKDLINIWKKTKFWTLIVKKK